MEGQMEFELKGALKKYGRMRSWRRIAAGAVALGGINAPWLLDFNRTDSLILWVGVLVFWSIAELEVRLKTIQVRLAGMDDKLEVLTGKETNENLILELNDW